uniref:Uncharacterized protein n=1 Tax=Ralstonia solanacearum TaxID=305 RepID=A0A0S4WLY0_RALSL|nr:protein of unknown function [Ralstonia solanacearum]
MSGRGPSGPETVSASAVPERCALNTASWSASLLRVSCRVQTPISAATISNCNSSASCPSTSQPGGISCCRFIAASACRQVWIEAMASQAYRISRSGLKPLCSGPSASSLRSRSATARQALTCRMVRLNTSTGASGVSRATARAGKLACRDKPPVELEDARDDGALASPLNSAGRAAWRAAAAGGLAAALVLVEASAETGVCADSRTARAPTRPPAMVFLYVCAPGDPHLGGQSNGATDVTGRAPETGGSVSLQNRPLCRGGGSRCGGEAKWRRRLRSAPDMTRASVALESGPHP